MSELSANADMYCTKADFYAEVKSQMKMTMVSGCRSDLVTFSNCQETAILSNCNSKVLWNYPIKEGACCSNNQVLGSKQLARPLCASKSTSGFSYAGIWKDANRLESPNIGLECEGCAAGISRKGGNCGKVEPRCRGSNLETSRSVLSLLCALRLSYRRSSVSNAL